LVHDVVVALFHCRWDYLKFCIYLEHKDKSDYTGPETYLAKCIEEDSLAWIPTGKAACLPAEEDLSVQEQQSRLEDSVKGLDQRQQSQFKELEGRFDRLEQMLGDIASEKASASASAAPRAAALARAYST
jgi:hypothetical protein